MALAYLLKNIDPPTLGFSLQLKALTIDHGLRAGSREEAHLVGERLRKLGESVRILDVARVLINSKVSSLK